MRQGGARAGSDDGTEGHAFGAGLAGGELELGGDSGLRDAGRMVFTREGKRLEP